MNNNLLTVTEVMEKFKVCKNTVYRRVQAKVLNAKRFPGGRRWYFDESEVMAALKNIPLNRRKKHHE